MCSIFIQNKERYYSFDEVNVIDVTKKINKKKSMGLEEFTNML